MLSTDLRARDLVVDELALASAPLRSGIGERLSSAAVFASVRPALHLHERVEVARVLDLRVPCLRRDGDVAERRASRRRIEDALDDEASSSLPFGNVTSIGEPTSRSCFVRIPVVDERAVARRGCANTSCEPSFHVSAITRAPSDRPRSRTSSCRRRAPRRCGRSDRRTTPGALRRGLAASTGIGEKLFWAVIA